MMNFNTKLRHGSGFYEPVGPSFSRAKKWKLDVEGTIIEFSAPKHQPMIKSEKAEIPQKQYRYEHHMIFKSDYATAVVWEYVTLFYHDWAFNGPWFTGCLADVSVEVSVNKSKTTNENVSYFHPKAFEQSIGDFLTNKYSKDKDEGKFLYQAPINWKTINNLSVIAARMDVVADGSITNYSKDEYLFFPIDNAHFITILFRPRRDARGTEAEIDKVIGYKNLGELIDNIVDSVKITLSPEAKAQQEKALEGLEDTSLVETFLPMDWRKSKSNTKKNQDALLTGS